MGNVVEALGRTLKDTGMVLAIAAMIVIPSVAIVACAVYIGWWTFPAILIGLVFIAVFRSNLARVRDGD